MPISSSPATMHILVGLNREGYEHTQHFLPAGLATFVCDSKVIERHHAHRESDPFLRNMKDGSIPKSLNRRGMYSRKKANARVFLFATIIFVLGFPNGQVLVLTRVSPILLDGPGGCVSCLHETELRRKVFEVDRSSSCGVGMKTHQRKMLSNWETGYTREPCDVRYCNQ